MKNLLLFILTINIITLYGQTIKDPLKSQLKDSINNSHLTFINILKRNHRDKLETTNVVLNMLNVDSIVFCDEKHPGTYALNEKTFITEYYLKSYTPIIDFEGFCAVYNITKQEQNLPFFIDGRYAYKPKKSYFEIGVILSVTVDVEQSSGMKYVNIKTLFPKPKYSGF